jgi:hypothetical protein
MKGYLIKKLFIIHFKGKKISIQQKMTRLGFLKTWPKSDHSKIHSYLFIKIFGVIFFNSHYVFHYVSHIDSL